jgi:hypothetical protein
MPRTVKNGHAATGALMPALDALTTESLKDLQSSDERRLLDVVDKLRRVGLNGTLELPQLVVCGDQSSGKSSVLEAITEIPFPRKAGLCTRFATEVRILYTSLSLLHMLTHSDRSSSTGFRLRYYQDQPEQVPN